MEKKLWWALNALGILAAVAAVVLGYEVWTMIRPQPIPEELVELNQLLDEFRQHRPLVLPESNKKEGNPSEDDVASDAIKVIENHINSVMLPSIQGFGSMSRKEYVRAIAEALVDNTKSIEDAFWICGMAQTESSYRIWAKPPRSTNSSARGLMQVIVKYHGDVLAPKGITKETLSTDINMSVQGGTLVFYKYLYTRKGKRTYKDATRRYRSLSATETQQQDYYNKIAAVFNKLKNDLRKELKSA